MLFGLIVKMLSKRQNFLDTPLICQVGYLNVVIPPDIISDDTSGDIMVPEGSPVKLTCNARGFPEPTITWRREDNTAIMLRSQSGTKSEGRHQIVPL